ncbi:nuclear transport factor 2 family protein [Aequorivita todarodis]|uniref:ester cyclase n=1 Tax=Aequorivita todarodis TaxID=2036821 RepID=UPI002350B313|nr:nuclear transport factor 2 family protein [Aequorivita todarodis]MDC7999521.1 nuclear transport factor 2 family protein [Aequorivita todarodis]
MKTSKLLLAIAFLSISTVFAQKSNIEKDLKMYEQVWSDIVNKGQIELINDKNFDPNVVQLNNTGNLEGIAAFRDYYQNFLTGFSNIKFTVKDIFGQGNNIAKHWSFTGKHTGNFFGIPPTGNVVNIEGVTIAKMKDGRIVQEQDFMDPNMMMQQLGLVSDPNNLSVVDNMYKAFAVGDIPTVLAGMDPKIVWNEAESNSLADGNPYIGPDAVLNGVFKRLGEEHEYFRLEDIQLHGMDNNQVLATLRYDAKVKKTGKTYNAQVAHLWTLKDGKVVAFQQFLDTEKVAEAMEN